MSDEENRTLIRRFMDLYNEWDPNTLDEIVAEDFVDHNPGLGQDGHGAQTTKTAFALMISAFSGRTLTHDHILSDGDMVAGQWTLRARHTGEILGVPATGKEVSIRWVSIWRIVDGRLHDRWGLLDRLGLLQQLGVVTSW